MIEIGILIGSLLGWRRAWTTADLSLAFLRFYREGNSFAYKQQSRKCDQDCQCRLALFRLLFTRLTLPHVKKPLVWTTNSRSSDDSRSLTDVGEELTDKKVLLIFSWGKCERDDCGLIHLRRSLDLNRFCRFP